MVEWLLLLLLLLVVAVVCVLPRVVVPGAGHMRRILHKVVVLPQHLAIRHHLWLFDVHPVLHETLGCVNVRRISPLKPLSLPLPLPLLVRLLILLLPTLPIVIVYVSFTSDRAFLRI